MRNSVVAGVTAGLLVLLGWPAILAAAPENNGQFPRHARSADAVPVARIIVGLRPDIGAARVEAPDAGMRALSARTGLAFRAERDLGPSMRVVELPAPVTGAALDDTLARLQSDPAVAFAEPDGRVFRHAVASDNLFPGQWYLQDTEVAALDVTGAWDVTTGSVGTVIAVLDTGVRFDHPDLQQAGRGGRLLPGHDFVGPDSGSGGFRVANDGDGWDPNPADPGDWVSAANLSLSLFAGCAESPSSWHGTRIAGMIGAITNNGPGIAGATWGTWILPVRVLGKCFGNNSDILQGMRWAAGLHVAGVPDNPYPARIINMSLGAPGTCTAGYLTVLDELDDIGVLVVASAGNDGAASVEYPANCPGVAGVAGLRHIGTKVGYSSMGPEVALAAPGGNCVNLTGACLFSLDTTSDTGLTAAVASTYTDQFDINVGTSFAAPQVAAIAALMQSVNGNLTAPQLIARLQEGTVPFPPPSGGLPVCPLVNNDLQCSCTTSTCGAGMANAPGSVAAALRPIAAIAALTPVAPGQDVTLDGGGSAAACGRGVASYQWTTIAGAATISGADTSQATVTAPASGSFTLRLTVTDDAGAADSAEVTVSTSAATTAAPASAGATACLAAIVPGDPGPFVDDGPVPGAQGGGGGGGGGALGPAGALLLAAALGRRRRLTRASRTAAPAV